MPIFEPFAALRYSFPDLTDLIAPPYDVLTIAQIEGYRDRSEHNIVWVDCPLESEGPDRYQVAGALLRQWVENAAMERDAEPSFTIYRMAFTDAAGVEREIVGVLGGIEVSDYGDGGVLPHENVTPKASTDRLDLTRATSANLSPIWGLSLAKGLAELLAAPGEAMGTVTVDQVVHTVERVYDPERIAAIQALIGSEDVMIADGHHRYGVAQQYRDEVRAATGSDTTPAEQTLCFVSELVEDQLSVEAIHRVYRSIGRDELEAALQQYFNFEDAGALADDTIAEMDSRAALRLAYADGTGAWLTPRDGAFAGERAIDGAWLETAFAGTDAEVTYQHGLQESRELLADDDSVTAMVLIRPISVAEIERTAREGLLLPPKVTFFTPKLRTGFVIREM